MPLKPHAPSTCRARRPFLRSRLACALALGGLALAAPGARADTPDEQWAYASGLYNQKLWSLAAENLDKFLKANPRDSHAALASYQLAAAILRTERGGKIDYARGAAAYEKALQEHPDPKLSGPAFFELADAYFNLDKFELAASTYARFLATKPKAEQGAEAAYMRGESLYALKKAEPARAAYAQVLADYPSSRPAPYAALALGTLAEDAKQLAQAATQYQTVWQKYPDSEVAGEARLRGASVFLGLKQFEKARASFEAALADAKLAKWKRAALVGLADAQFGLKDWPAAAGSYQKALAEPLPDGKAASDASALQLRLADSFFNAKRWQDAVQAYAPLVASSNVATAANALYFRGLAQFEVGNKSAAASDFGTLLQKFPAHEKAPRAALRLGDIRAEAKDSSGAAQAYKSVIAKFPASPEAKDAQQALLDLVGSVAASTSTSAAGSAAVGSGASASSGAVPEALESVLRALPAGRASDSARIKLARAAYERGDWAQASALSQGALDAKPDAATRENALYLLGSARLNAGQPSEASVAFQKLLAANTKGALAPSAQLGLAWARLDPKVKDWAGAQAAATAGLSALATSKTPDKTLAARLKLALGEAQWRAKSYAPAAASLASFGGQDKEMAAQAAFFAASSYESLGDSKNAAAQWSKYAASASEPAEQARGQLRRGLALSKLKDAASRAAAQAAYDRALALDAKGDIGARALYESAWSASEAKSADAAGKWQRLAREFPSSKYAASAQFQIAESLFAAKKWDEAAAAYEAVTQASASEDAPLAWYQRGSALYNAQQWGQASASFARAAEFPKSEAATESLFWAGQSQLKGGDARAARPFLEKFLAQAAAKTSPADAKASWRQWIAPARLGLARALVEANEGAKAESVARQVLAGATGSAAAEGNFRLAQALFAQGKWKDAASAALRVSTLAPQSEWAPEASWVAAQASEKGGDAATAKALYRAIADAQPASPWATQATEKLAALATN